MITKSWLENRAKNKKHDGTANKHKGYRYSCSASCNKGTCTGSFTAPVNAHVHGSADSALRCMRNYERQLENQEENYEQPNSNLTYSRLQQADPRNCGAC